jgi:xylose isomerase
MILDGRLQAAVDARYAGWDTTHGQAVLAGRVSLSELADQVLRANVDKPPVSGRQEALENLVNRFCGH